MANVGDIFGTLPDVIDDDWIDDEERLEWGFKKPNQPPRPGQCVRPALRRRLRLGGRTTGALREGVGASRREAKAAAWLGNVNVSMPRLFGCLIRDQIFLMKRS